MAYKEQTVRRHEPLDRFHNASARLRAEIDQQVPAEDDVIGPFAGKDTIIQEVSVDEMYSLSDFILQEILATHGHEVTVAKRFRHTAKRMYGVNRMLRLAEQGPADVERVDPVVIRLQSCFPEHHGDRVRLLSA